MWHDTSLKCPSQFYWIDKTNECVIDVISTCLFQSLQGTCYSSTAKENRRKTEIKSKANRKRYSRCYAASNLPASILLTSFLQICEILAYWKHVRASDVFLAQKLYEVLAKSSMQLNLLIIQCKFTVRNRYKNNYKIWEVAKVQILFINAILSPQHKFPVLSCHRGFCFQRWKWYTQ